MSLTYSQDLDLGSKLPVFKLKTTEDQWVSEKDFSNQILVISFICNHCPYVKAIEDRLITTANDIKELGGAWLAVCSNDASEYPEDSFESLRDRAREKSYPFFYAVDESQQFAKKMQAVCTPDFFVFDSQHLLRYRGRLDDSWRDPKKVRRSELLEAARALARGGPVDPDMKPAMGCSIKWTLPTVPVKAK